MVVAGDRKRRSENRSSVGSRGSVRRNPTERSQPVPSQSTVPANHTYRHDAPRRYHPRQPPRLRRGANKYESEDFKQQRMQQMEAANKHKYDMISKRQERIKKLADLTTELNSLVGKLSLLPKDAPEREGVSQQIQDVKFAMRRLQMERETVPNKIDNRQTKLLFKELPECAKGPGKLAEWIAGNAVILLPKQIAMLATAAQGALIQYRNHGAAETVMRSCKLHGIEAQWAPVEHEEGDGKGSEAPAKAENAADVDYNLL
ncbi:hypothetical protein, conserved [Babesia bigemina]|uniref:Uncharacterized protein n=1 Tax=Babesia bigemina TaxID=5866 RepID=A0A061CZ62_BABBI|nr:hypothetical protein, conserved [Babesia bigemina]CDR93728.1 hypothetical protein, conserved [Babesia bigemina]|eukprot:XP_012765914.1 hypothetical protein, conserved [Babesia bigemina]